MATTIDNPSVAEVVAETEHENVLETLKVKATINAIMRLHEKMEKNMTSELLTSDVGRLERFLGYAPGTFASRIEERFSEMDNIEFHSWYDELCGKEKK